MKTLKNAASMTLEYTLKFLGLAIGIPVAFVGTIIKGVGETLEETVLEVARVIKDISDDLKKGREEPEGRDRRG